MKWPKQGAWGFVIGSIVTMILGFGWGGWITTASAHRMALDRTNTAVTAALVPVCLEKSKADPSARTKIPALRALSSSFDQRDAVIKDGWASVGGGEPNRDVAEACATQLLEVAKK